MRDFGARGGWWVVGQAALLCSVAGALLLGGEDWGSTARYAGVAVSASGAVLAVLGLVTLGESLTPFPAPRTDGVLVERGVYRLVRHPIYGGIGIGSVGLGLFDGNPLTIWAGTALILYLWAKAGHEEQRLISHFPEYSGYRTRVKRRLIPWVM